MKKALEKIISRTAKKQASEEELDINATVRGPILFGLLVILIFFVIGYIWAITAPIDSAAIAQGTVVLESNKKTIQHLEGGIVSDILVTEGEIVEAGQELLKLSATSAKASKGLVDSQIAAYTATESRLITERDNLKDVQFPSWLINLARDNTEVGNLLAGEKSLFDTRRKSIEGHINILNQKTAQLKDQISGLSAQVRSANKQIGFLTQERDTVQKLIDIGQSTMPRLLSIKRQLAELQGNRGEYQSSIAESKQAIIENELEMINVKNTHLKEVVELLQQTQNQLADLYERRRAVDDIVERVVITAPQSGIVTNLKVFTIGGVIRPGDPILDIVPQDDRLVIEAHVQPADIDVVRQGLKSRVRLTAFKTRKIPMIDGVVLHVSPDKFTDKQTNSVYFKAKILLNQDTLDSLVDDIELYPGMPADVLIVTGERTLINYLLAPITDTINNAFREE
ncbi:MAG: HlyD family type I secretion periplasmic adaptor subunit [Pseudomonadota bacterium]